MENEKSIIKENNDENQNLMDENQMNDYSDKDINKESPLKENECKMFLKKDEGINFENRLEVPSIEKQRGDDFLKKEEYDTALKHYSKVIICIKVLQEDKNLSPEQIDLDKLIRTYGVIFLYIIDFNFLINDIT